MSDRTDTLTPEQMGAFLDLVSLPFSDSTAAMAYHRVHVARYALTVNALKRLGLPRQTRALELAASPYGMSAYLAAEMYPDLTLATYAEPSATTERSIKVRGDVHTLTEHGFNVEREGWPFENDRFDLVIACEIIEHLAMDPMSLLAEGNRVLRPGGHLFISTPNACSLQNFIKLAQMLPAGLAPHFRKTASLASIYERHNREYSAFTLGEMFRAAGFEIVVMETDSAWIVQDHGMSQESIEALLALIGIPELRRDTLTVVGRKVSGVVERYPTVHDLYID